jgi:hypothetical protein
MSKETDRNILIRDLGIRKLAAKLVPPNLREEQKDRRLTLCIDFAEQIQEDNFLDRVVTGNGTCYQFDPKAKRQSMKWR